MRCSQATLLRRRTAARGECAVPARMVKTVGELAGWWADGQTQCRAAAVRAQGMQCSLPHSSGSTFSHLAEPFWWRSASHSTSCSA